MSLLTLPDGRVLEVAVSGPEDGVPLVFHHGTPGAATQFRFLQRAASLRSLRLVSYARPGYGKSTRRPGRRVVDAADDVAAILDHLGSDLCVTAGWSGGGPHTLATAARLPDRVAAVLSIAGAGPSDAESLDFTAGMGEQNLIEFDAAFAGESDLRARLDEDAAGVRQADARGLIDEMSTLLPDVDRAVLTDEYGEDLVASFRDGLRTGIDGWVDDDLAFVRPWGFDLDEIAVPAYVWQGSDDLMVPFAHGRWLSQQIPTVTSHLESGHGHLSVGIGMIDAMLDELVANL